MEMEGRKLLCRVLPLLSISDVSRLMYDFGDIAGRISQQKCENAPECIECQLIFTKYNIYFCVFNDRLYTLCCYNAFGICNTWQETCDSTKSLVLFLNSFLVMLISLAISFLVGLFVKNRQQVSIIVTPISLAFCFLCGVFVPIQYMPDGIVYIARFLPIYWFETVNDLLAKHADISGHIQSQILRGMGMELLFFIVLISCSMAVAKYQQQEG